MAMGNAKDLDLDELEDGAEINDEDKDDDEEGNEAPDGDEEGEEESEDDEDGGDEPPEDDEDEPDTDDKKTKKIIATKKKLKEANARIAELERKEQEALVDRKVQDKKDEMIEEGYSQKDIDAVISVFKKNTILQNQLDAIAWETLKRTYPNIENYREQIVEVQKKLPDASIEDIYLTKFSKNSSFDTKTKIQQEMQYKQSQSKAKSNGNAGGTGSGEKVIVKLSPEDEGAYLILKKSNPSMTRKQFKTLVDEEELS